VLLPRVSSLTLHAMHRLGVLPVARSLVAALMGVTLLTSAVVAADVQLQPDTKGCTGVLPSTDGNTDMQLVGGTLVPGGTAVFEITHPLDASSVGKEFTILACAYVNDVATLKYVVSFVPSNQLFRLRMTFAIPEDAPVGGEYCNYVKTTRAPTAPQSSQRKAGPTCFIIQAPSILSHPPGGGSPPRTGSTTGGGGTPASEDPGSIPDTAIAY
jgi:hypothetical protein